MRNFRKALLSTFSVLLCFFLLIAGVSAPYYTADVYYYQDEKVRRELAGSFDLLVSSASQGLRAIDPLVLDSELGCTAYDLGTPLQTMYGRYLFLKKELERNPVSTVILELSYDAMSRAYEDHGLEGSIYQLGRSDNLGQWLDYFFHQVPPGDYAQLLYDTLNRGVYAWKQVLSGNVKEPVQYESHGFLPGLKAKPMPSKDTYLTDYKKDPLSTEVQEENREYLEKCIQLCQEKGIEVILVTTPLSEYKLWNSDGLDEILETHREISRKWKVPFYDFNLKKDKLERYSEETAYYDKHHLCEESAAVFSRDLAEVMKAFRAGENIDELFYESYDEAIHARFEG